MGDELLMPYIDPVRRVKLLEFKDQPQNAGELNFLITHLITNYISFKGEKYQHYNDVIGALEGAKIELYRRKIAPYEDVKALENGDVYE
jgi:hypothetical protein